MLDHYCLSIDDILSKQNFTKHIWENCLRCAYNPYKSSTVDDDTLYKQHISKISCNLIDESDRQRDFFYQVSLPHFRMKNFLNLCVNRYKKYLHIKKLNSQIELPVCNAINLIRQTHQLNPQAYNNDLLKLFLYGDLCCRNNARLSISTLSTDLLWDRIFQESFFFPATVHRGHKPDTNRGFSWSETIDFNSYFLKKGTFRLIEMKLKEKINKNDDRDIALSVSSSSNKSVKFCTKVVRGSKTLYKGVLTTDESLKFDQAYEYHRLNNDSLDLKVVLSLKQSNSSKLLGKFKMKPEKSSASETLGCDFYITEKLMIPENKVEIQEIVTDLVTKSRLNNRFLLEQRWQVEYELEKSLFFRLEKKEFKTMTTRDILYEKDYSGVFDFKNLIEQPYQEKCAIRTRHNVTIFESDRFMELYQLEILHIAPIQWSSLRLMQNEKLLVTSHLIGLDQLPLLEQLNSEHFKWLSFNPARDRAMLIRNVHGDYAIIKGEWIRPSPKSIPSAAKTLSGHKKTLIYRPASILEEEDEDLGHLMITLYLIEKKVFKKFRIPNSFIFVLNNKSIKSIVDLKSGMMEMQFIDDDEESDQSRRVGSEMANTGVENNIAIMFSIALLHVLLQPKSYDLNAYNILKSMGFYELASLDSFNTTNRNDYYLWFNCEKNLPDKDSST